MWKFCQFYTVSKTRLVISEDFFLKPQYVIHKPKIPGHDQTKDFRISLSY